MNSNLLKAGNLGCALALALGLAALTPSSARAAALSIDDTSPADTITVGACDYEGGASLNGVPFGSCGVGAGGTVTVPEAGPVVFAGHWHTLSGTPGAIDRTIYFLEFGTNQVSDIFHYVIDDDGVFATIHATFLSDGEASLGELPAGIAPGDVFMEPERGNLSVEFGWSALSGVVMSDGADVVPEPASLALLGLGLAGLGFLRRKRA